MHDFYSRTILVICGQCPCRIEVWNLSAACHNVRNRCKIRNSYPARALRSMTGRGQSHAKKNYVRSAPHQNKTSLCIDNYMIWCNIYSLQYKRFNFVSFCPVLVICYEVSTLFRILKCVAHRIWNCPRSEINLRGIDTKDMVHVREPQHQVGLKDELPTLLKFFWSSL
jgi:hypothetical protein